MAQAQLDVVNFHMHNEDLKSIQRGERQISVVLDDKVTLIIKRAYKKPYILIQSGKKHIKLSIDTFKTICDSKISVLFLKNLLEENRF